MKFTEEDWQRTAQLAYGPLPKDGVLLTGAEIQFFARKTIERIVAPLTLLGEPE